MRIVIDTNCLLVSIPKISKTRWLFDLILNEKIEFGLTTDILNEYQEVIGRFYSQDLANNLNEMLVNNRKSRLITPFYFWNLIEKDPDDNKFVDCAIACNADLIVTHDKHFLTLNKIQFPKVEIMNLKHFQNHLLELGCYF